MNFLQKTGAAIAVSAAVIYIGAVFILPAALNLNSFKADLQKAAKEQSGLNIDFADAKLIVTPLLSAGVKIEGLSAALPDGASVFSASSIEGTASIPHLLFKTVKITKAEAVNPVINIDIADGRKYRLQEHFEKLSENLDKEGETQQAEAPAGAAFDLSSIKIDIPKVNIYDYEVFINDLKTKDYLKLRGNELALSYKSGKTASIKTIAELFLNENKNITADIDIDTFVPDLTAMEAENTPAAEENTPEIQFINPAALYKTYDLKAEISSKLKIREKNGRIVSDGYFNIDGLTLVLSGINLPKSTLHTSADGTKINADAGLYLTNEENISIKAQGDYGSNPSLDMTVKSNEIHTENVLELVKAALYTADIKNDLNKYRGSGYFTADAEIKTDFKTLNSKGAVNFKDIKIRDAANNAQIAEINSAVLLDGNILKITDTVIKACDAVFKAEGTINEQTYADIKVVMDRMSLTKAFELFLPENIKKNYTVNAGSIDLSADIKGHLSEPQGKIKFSLANLSLKDKAAGINYFNNLLTADFEGGLKGIKGVINNSDFNLSMNGASVTCDKLSIDAGDKNLVINPAVIKVNNKTNVNLKGTVKDYITNPVFNINAEGALKTADLKQLLGPEAAVYIKEKGSLPFSADITGDQKVQTITASIAADSSNYITPVDIKSVLNKNTVLSTVMELKDNKLSIKDTGLFVKEGSSKTAAASIEGVISRLDTASPVINTLKIRLPKSLECSLAVFPQSKFTADGDIAVSGSLNSPKIRGGFNISNASIPELAMTLEKAAAKFEDKNLDIELSRLKADGSDFNIVINSDLTPSKYFTIKNLNLISEYMDADKLAKLSETFAKYTAPKAEGSSNSSASSAAGAPADIPAVIKDGTIDIKEIKSGGIHLTETSGRISLAKNVFYIKNLIASAFKGKIKGDVSMNLISSEIKADVKGSGMDAAQALLEAAAMKDTLSGELEFDAALSLKGASYEEQVKSLKGSTNFTIKNGSLGPIGRIENLVTADNLTSSSALRTLVNTTLSSAVDTSRFSILKGSLTFDKGIARINPITSAGDYMSTYIFGNFDVLKNTADLKLRGRLGSKVTESMGQLAALNPVNIIKSSSGMNLILGKLMLTLCEKVTEEELNQIPAIEKESSDDNTAKFQAVIRGDAAKPLKLVRSFKWLESESRIKEAEAKLSLSSALTVPGNLKEAKQQTKDILKNLSTEGTQELQQQGKEALNALKSIFNTVKPAPPEGN